LVYAYVLQTVVSDEHLQAPNVDKAPKSGCDNTYVSILLYVNLNKGNEEVNISEIG